LLHIQQISNRRLKLTNTIYIVGFLRMVAPPWPGGMGLPCHGTAHISTCAVAMLL